MNANRQAKRGWTLIEIMAAVLVMALALTAAISGWMYVLRGERMNSVQNELDIDVRKAMERIRVELRASSMDKVFFYPEGPGPYEAISFPSAIPNPVTGLLNTNSEGKILWDETRVYHEWNPIAMEPEAPNELKLTIFNPRDNNLPAAQRQTQLAIVVEYGNGSGAPEGAGATSRAIFQNLFDWKIWGKGAQYDAYSESVGREANVNLGSVLLIPGSHAFKFSVIGKNSSSSGRKIGLDSLVVSPCGVPREAEAQLPALPESGATAVGEEMTAGAWDGNYHLSFPSTADGHTFTLTMANDQWEETNFKGEGALCEDTVVEYDETLSPKDFVVRIPLQTNSWQADWQTLDDLGGWSSNDALRGFAVRVLIRGTKQTDGGGIRSGSPLHCVNFVSGAQALNVLGAYVAEAASSTTCVPDITGASVQLLLDGNPSFTIVAGGNTAKPKPASSFAITNDKSYMVSFLVINNAGQSDARFWNEMHTNPPMPGCYVIPGVAGPTLADLTAANWSGNTNVTTSPKLYAVKVLHNLCPPEGYFTSQIVDTKLTAPVYTSIGWNSVVPAGTYLGMRVRTGNSEDMSDAPAWSNVTAMTESGGLSVSSKRYVQLQAEMRSTNVDFQSFGPSLKDVKIAWNGETRVVDIGANVTKGPDYGVFDLKVDDKPLAKGVTIDLTIYEDVRGWHGVSNRLTSTLTAEVEPRNTGK